MTLLVRDDVIGYQTQSLVNRLTLKDVAHTKRQYSNA